MEFCHSGTNDLEVILMPMPGNLSFRPNLIPTRRDFNSAPHIVMSGFSVATVIDWLSKSIELVCCLWTVGVILQSRV